jgi:hypothetical protein
MLQSTIAQFRTQTVEMRGEELLMSSFRQYIEDHTIEPLRLCIVAGVRYAVVWNATKGNAISQEHAQKIRVALQRLTGTVYPGILVTLAEKPVDQLLTLPDEENTWN